MARIDTEELLIQLHEVGIDTVITPSQGNIVLELRKLSTGRTLAHCKSDSIEECLATIIKRSLIPNNPIKNRLSLL